MAVKKVVKYIVVPTIVAAVSVAAVVYWPRHDPNGFAPDDLRFVTVFVEMSIAREMAGNDNDTLKILYDEIFENYDVDSLWLYNYVVGLPHDADKHQLIWDSIVEKLDSLKENPYLDSL